LVITRTRGSAAATAASNAAVPSVDPSSTTRISMSVIV